MGAILATELLVLAMNLQKTSNDIIAGNVSAKKGAIPATELHVLAMNLQKNKQ